ncbi:MAG: hypothetical protein R2797_05205 [Gelidibacter sp.]
MPERTPGYVFFVKSFEFIFPNTYAPIVVAAQLVLGLFAVHFFYNRIAWMLSLNYLIKIIVLVLLIAPFFPPLLVANNICSEGLSYPFYLFFLSFGFEFLNTEKKRTFFLFFISYLLLVLTRGQFLITSAIFALVYFFKHRSGSFKRRHFIRFALICIFPLFVIFTDRSYHKLKDGVFKSTPYTYVNISASAFYVSNESDAEFIENEEYRELFRRCHQTLSRKNLLLSSKKRKGYEEYYQHFHNHVPQICNQTVHDISRDYFFKKYLNTNTDLKKASVYSLWQSELFCKNVFFVLIKHNFASWLHLYCSNIVHGFKSIFLLLFVVLIFLISTFKVFLGNHKNYSLLFVMSALTLSNAMIVSLASHSIIRYLFYNYVLILLMLVILFKLFSNAKRH